MGHKAIIAKIVEVIEIPNADKIHIGIVLGERVVVSKEWGVGFVGVFFPVEVQLSDSYVYYNNLYRDSTKNINHDAKGFFDVNRRVRAQPFLKVRSEGFFAGLESLSFTDVEMNTLTVGYEFDVLNGEPICCKYVSEKTKKAIGNQNTKTAKINFATSFAKHIDSVQFRHYAQDIQKGSLLSFHSKQHGTSFRVGRVDTHVELNWFQKQVNKLVNVYPVTKMDYVVGTRNVILKNSDSEGFHGSEQYRFDIMNELKPYLDDNMLIYGEIVGYVNGRAIMSSHSTAPLKDKKAKDKYGDSFEYSYGCKPHEYKWFVYRIAHVVNGEVVDMSQQQLEHWCQVRGITHTLDVHPQVIYDGDLESLTALVEGLAEREEHLGADPQDETHLHEGVVVRVDSGKNKPEFYKYKTYRFRVCEGHCEAVDAEDAS